MQATPLNPTNDPDDLDLPDLDLSILGGKVSDIGNVGFGGDDSHQAPDCFASSNWSLDDADGDWTVAPQSSNQPASAAIDTAVIPTATIDRGEGTSFDRGSINSDEPKCPPPELEHVTEGISELQRLVSKIEQATPNEDLSPGIDELEVSDQSEASIDELPDAWLFAEGPNQTASVVGMSSRDAAIAELDALLASYSEEVLNPSLAEVDLDHIKTSDALDDEVDDESTFELASGETWYEGQPLEGESMLNEDSANQVVDAAAEADEVNVGEERSAIEAASIADEAAVVDDSIDTVKDAQELVAHTERLLHLLRHDEPLIESSASIQEVDEVESSDIADVADDDLIMDPADVFELTADEVDAAATNAIEANEVAIQELEQVIESSVSVPSENEAVTTDALIELTAEIESSPNDVSDINEDVACEPLLTALEHRFSVEDADDVGFDEARTAARQALFEASSRSMSAFHPEEESAVEEQVELDAELGSDVEATDAPTMSDEFAVEEATCDEVAPAVPSLFSFAATHHPSAGRTHDIPTGSLLAQFLHHDDATTESVENLPEEPVTTGDLLSEFTNDEQIQEEAAPSVASEEAFDAVPVESEPQQETHATEESSIEEAFADQLDDVEEPAPSGSIFGVSTENDSANESVIDQPTGFLLAQIKADEAAPEDNAPDALNEPDLLDTQSSDSNSEEVTERSSEMFSTELSAEIEDTRQASYEDDSASARPSLFGASSEPEAELLTGSLLAQLERKPVEDADETKLSELRSQLADLFGIKNAPAIANNPVADEKPLDDRFNSFFTGGKSVEELDERGALVEEANPILENSEPSAQAAVVDTQSESEKPVTEKAPSTPPAADDPIRA